MLTEISSEVIDKIAIQAANIVCDRIGNALMKVGAIGIAAGIAIIFFSNKCTCCSYQTGPMVIKSTNPETGEVTRTIAPSSSLFTTQ